MEGLQKVDLGRDFTKLKVLFRGLLAKQNRMGYTLVDIIVKVYSHAFLSHYSRTCPIKSRHIYKNNRLRYNLS